jgi:predicted RNA-binding Zn-ribbon protein involved in translation (DUF1610 family)
MFRLPTLRMRDRMTGMKFNRALPLVHGPYQAPACQVGEALFCERHQRELRVAGLTDAPIVWPYGPRRSLIVCGDLLRAIRTEGASAVAYHWGVNLDTVWAWRKAVGVPQFTEGTIHLFHNAAGEKAASDPDRARARSHTVEARAKMSATRTGRPSHPNTRKAASEVARRPKSESFRRLMSERVRLEWESGLRKGHPPGRSWTDDELALLGTDTDASIAQAIGRTPSAVQKIRLRFGIACFSPVMNSESEAYESISGHSLLEKGDSPVILTNGVRRSRTVKQESACPECGNPIKTEAPSNPGNHYVCSHCGAISISGSDGYPRLLCTDEWLAIIHAPDFLDLLERRELIMEKSTVPGEVTSADGVRE